MSDLIQSANALAGAAVGAGALLLTTTKNTPNLNVGEQQVSHFYSADTGEVTLEVNLPDSLPTDAPVEVEWTLNNTDTGETITIDGPSAVQQIPDGEYKVTVTVTVDGEVVARHNFSFLGYRE